MNDKKQIDALTGLRFIAACVVFIHHLGGKFGIPPFGYSLGSLAVTFFFVLSGFILVYVYDGRLNNAGQTARFFFNRFARIWPLHIVCLLIAALVFGNGNISWIFGQKFIGRLVANVLLLQSWVPDKAWVFSFNGVSWSISTESFFYLVFPILISAAGRAWIWRVLVSMAVVLAAAFLFHLACRGDWWNIDFVRLGHSTPIVRLPEFLLGVIAGKVFLARSKQALDDRKPSVFADTLQELGCLSLIVLAVIWFTDYRIQFVLIKASWGSLFLGSWARVAYPSVLFAFAVYTFARSNGVIARACSTKLMIYLGEISYAFYMIHFIVLRIIDTYAFSYGELSSFQIAGLALLCCIAASMLLYHWVEMPAKFGLHRLFLKKRSPAEQNCKRRWIPAVASNLLIKTTLAGVIMATSASALSHFAVKQSPSAESEKLLENSAASERFVDFGDEYRLQSYSFAPDKDRLKIDLAWIKRTDADYRRIVLLLDSTDKEVARGRHNQKRFKEAEVGREFIDTVYVSMENLAKSDSIVVCFRKKGLPVLFADRGDRKNRGRSLVLLDNKQIAEVKQQIKNAAKTPQDDNLDSDGQSQ